MQKKYNDSYHHYTKCYEIVKTILGNDGPKTMHYLHLCANVKSYTVNFKEAIPIFEHILTFYKQKGNSELEQMIDIKFKVLMLYLKSGDHTMAFKIVDKIILDTKIKVTIV